MSRRVNFKTLWLVSARDGKARRQPFGNKTLLFGENGTGKSRVTKNLFWALGCNPPKRTQGAWDPDTVAAVEFEFKGQRYMCLREGKRLGLFGPSDELLFAANTMGTWEAQIGKFFGFTLRLRRPQSNVFAQAGMDYLLLPFYMDQDGSWGHNWATFENLGQFTRWKEDTFEAFIGLHPNAYFEATHERDEATARIQEKQRELDAQDAAFSRVRKLLPKNLPALNFGSFRAELAELGRKALKLQQEQVKIRSQLLQHVNARQRLHSELAVAQKAFDELKGDFTYLADHGSPSIECPTCGTVHANSFHARLQLSSDIESLTALMAELRSEVANVADKEAEVRSRLREAEKMAQELEGLQQERRAKLKLEDIMASQSKKTLDTAFHQVHAGLASALRRLEETRARAAAKVKKFDEPERVADVNKYFSGQVLSLSHALNVPSEEQIANPNPGTRAQSGGSSAPRSMLAVHLAMLATNVKWGDTPMFPFVVDTLAHSGQDDRNLRKMIETLGRMASLNHQVILAAERLPDGVELGDFDTVTLTEPRSLLSSAEFDEVTARLAAPLAALNATLRPAPTP